MTRTLRQPEVSRRALLAGMAGSAAFLAMPASVLAQAIAPNPMFRHGVASGDPDATSVVLWTRLTAAAAVKGTWELSTTPDFAEVTKTGPFSTDADRDHTVKVLAEGLEPGGIYYYRFRVGEALSVLGRARTLPEGQLDRLGIALMSCSNYAFGFFNAYDVMPMSTSCCIPATTSTNMAARMAGAPMWPARSAASTTRCTTSSR